MALQVSPALSVTQKASLVELGPTATVTLVTCTRWLSYFSAEVLPGASAAVVSDTGAGALLVSLAAVLMVMLVTFSSSSMLL